MKTITLYAIITCNLGVINNKTKKISKIAYFFKTNVLSNGQYIQS